METSLTNKTVALLVPLRPVLEWLSEPFDRLFAGRGGVFMLLVPVIPFVAYDALWSDAFPVTHAIIDDWFNHASSLTMVVFGYLAAKSPVFWQAVDRARHLALAVAVATGGVRLAGSLSLVEVTGEALSLIRIIFTWAVIAAMLGFAQRHLNRTGPVLRYLTDAVFPYYILHQTLIVCIGVWAAGLPLWAEAPVVVLGTLLGCGLGYELVRRVGVLRPLFGLPLRPRTGYVPAPTGVRI